MLSETNLYYGWLPIDLVNIFVQMHSKEKKKKKKRITYNGWAELLIFSHIFFSCLTKRISVFILRFLALLLIKHHLFNRIVVVAILSRLIFILLVISFALLRLFPLILYRSFFFFHPNGEKAKKRERKRVMRTIGQYSIHFKCSAMCICISI